MGSMNKHDKVNIGSVGISLYQIYSIIHYIETGGVKPHNHDMRVPAKVKEHIIHTFELSYDKQKRKYTSTYESIFQKFCQLYPDFIIDHNIKDYNQLYALVSSSIW
jgi:hypothetical protein